MKKIIFVALLACLSMQVFAQNASKKAKIQELLVLTGSAEMGKQAIEQMVDIYKKAYSNVESKFWDNFVKEADMNELVNLIIPIYDEHYTEEEIEQLIAFYKTPIGKKTIEKMPAISQQSMTVGQQWGMQIGLKVMNQLREQGYDID